MNPVVVIWHRQQNPKRCFYCGRELLQGKAIREYPGPCARAFTKDHVVPLSRGGSDEIENIVFACYGCNHYKGDLSADQFRAKLYGPSVEFYCEREYRIAANRGRDYIHENERR